MDTEITPELARFRAEHLEEFVPALYSGWLHFGWTNAVSLAVVTGALSQLDGVAPAEWLAVPLSLVFANLAEYRLHRHPMHRRVAALGLLFDRHTLTHHRYFHHDSMAIDSAREMKMVLFPAWAVLGLAALVVPVASVLWAALGANVAWLFVATGLAYFVGYEWLHLAYHLDPDGPIGRLPGMAALREHHRVHHDPKLMTRYNFNVHVPLGDWLHGSIAPTDRVR